MICFFQSSLINRKFTEITFIWNISKLVNIWNGSKHLIKVLKPKCVLVLGPLWWSFSIHFRCWLLYFVSLLFFTTDQFNASLPSKNIYIKKALTKLLNSIWLVIIHDWKGNWKVMQVFEIVIGETFGRQKYFVYSGYIWYVSVVKSDLQY